jgi:hypothetical protein
MMARIGPGGGSGASKWRVPLAYHSSSRNAISASSTTQAQERLLLRAGVGQLAGTLQLHREPEVTAPRHQQQEIADPRSHSHAAEDRRLDAPSLAAVRTVEQPPQRRQPRQTAAHDVHQRQLEILLATAGQ